MKIYQRDSDYDYSFPTVTLAYFLRYPNPYATHVTSTDVLDRYIDPETKRLHTVRLHLKKSKVPAGILKFLPSGLTGPGGATKSFVLERSIVDVKEGWMETESKNLEWTGILSVLEKQTYRDQSLMDIPSPSGKKEWTTCKTSVTFVSHLGQTLLKRKKTGTTANADDEEAQPKQGWLASISTAGIQRTIELIGVKRTKTALTNSNEGMKLVMERLRSGGIVEVLEGMRQDRLAMLSGDPIWQQQHARVVHKDDEVD